MNKNLIDFEKIPQNIRDDQYYYLCLKKLSSKNFLDFGIGDLVGKSLRGDIFVNINNNYIKFSPSINNKSKIVINSIRYKQTFILFRKYKEFKDYILDNYLDNSEDSKSKVGSSGFCVNKKTYFCLYCRNILSKPKRFRSEHKVFDTKEEAIDFSSHGLKRTIIFLEKQNSDAKKLLDKVENSIKESKFTSYDDVTKLFFNLLLKSMDNLKVGDKLFRLSSEIDSIDIYFPPDLYKINEDFYVVKEKIGRDLLLISNSRETLIISKVDLNISRNFFYSIFTEDKYSEVNDYLDFINLCRIKLFLESSICWGSIKIEYCKEYKPFTRSSKYDNFSFCSLISPEDKKTINYLKNYRKL